MKLEANYFNISDPATVIVNKEIEVATEIELDTKTEIKPETNTKSDSKKAKQNKINK